MVLVILVNEIARVGRLPWVVLVGGCDLGVFGGVGPYLGTLLIEKGPKETLESLWVG